MVQPAGVKLRVHRWTTGLDHSSLVEAVNRIRSNPKINCGKDFRDGSTLKQLRRAAVCTEQHCLLPQRLLEQGVQVLDVVVVAAIAAILVLHLCHDHWSPVLVQERPHHLQQEPHPHVHVAQVRLIRAAQPHGLVLEQPTGETPELPLSTDIRSWSKDD